MNRVFISQVLLCIFSTYFVNAQELPKVVPPTPEAASLFQFQDYPVDYSTGIPQIIIPIYEIKSGGIIVPINIAYHSSGRKVYDETGAIGLGWTLMAGGRISRTINGEADDNDNEIKFPSPWKRQADINVNENSDMDFLEGAFATSYPIPWYDTEYDFFSYSVNSVSGKFVLRDDNNVKIPVLIPKKPYVVQYHKANTQYNINYFDYLVITDDLGTLYRFGKSLRDGSEYHETSSGSTGITSWMLTEIISPDKVDTVFFKYQSFSKHKRTTSQKTTIIDQISNCSSNAVDPASIEEDGFGTYQDQHYNLQRLIEIKFRNGIVEFQLKNGDDIVEGIQIKNLKNEVIRVISFSHLTQDMLSDGNAPTKVLSSVKIKDNNNNVSEHYKLDYYPTVYPSGYNVVESKFRDLWGYYNASGSLNMRPRVENVSIVDIMNTYFTTIGAAGAGRMPNLEATKSGVLKKITFPTGGAKEFFYEQNKYLDPATSHIASCGGLRLAGTIVYDGLGNQIFKTYTYGLSESGYGTLPFIPNVHNMSYETKHRNFLVAEGTCANTCSELYFRTRVFSSEVLPIFDEYLHRPVYYPEVIEYHGTLSDNIGKTVYKYDMGSQFNFPNSVQNLFINSDPKYWKTNSLIEQTDLKKVGNTYINVRIITNEYSETVYDEDKVWGMHVGKSFIITPEYLKDLFTGQYYASYYGGWTGCGAFTSSEVFKFADYSISVGKKELISSTETIIDDNGNSFSTTTEYAYNNYHLPSRTIKTVNDNDKVVIESKYPFDFPNESIHSQMINRNMLNYSVEVNSFRNATPNFSTKTTYRNWGGHIIKPEIISTRYGTSTYEPRIVFHSYDASGNLQCVSKDGGPRISYLYGYKNELPIAEIINSSPNQFFHTSFEDQEGNSGENDSKTGRNSRKGGYFKTLSGLPAGTYALSYFKKNGNTWELIQVSNISVTNGTYNINLQGQVDEVRFFPQESTMTTYSHDPLVGVLSITDRNNIIIYYEHDTFNRLMKIKDVNSHTLKQFDYHYKN